ncbi:MAG TPA: hypothetical protein VK555_06530 [Terriglobales bacterium]|jgi:uncharacterized membrane protein|nr:hypothetical protein [Terriglobales bacterium]
MTSFRNFALLVPVLLNVGLIHAQTPTDISARLTFTTIDVPGAGYTGVFGINIAGDMVGNYGQSINGDSHGFLCSNGSFTYFDYPGQSVTAPSGINDFGVIVGYASKTPGATQVFGFLYDGITYTVLRAPGNPATFASAINNAGWVVGGAGTVYNTWGFEMRNGRYKPINFPGGNIYARARGINNLGQVVGWADSGTYLYSGGKFKLINFPGADRTVALGINDNGVIVGWYLTGSVGSGFAFRNGKYISFNYPGAVFTAGVGVNTSGQIVGQYQLPDNTYHGFVTSPIAAADF